MQQFEGIGEAIAWQDIDITNIILVHHGEKNIGQKDKRTFDSNLGSVDSHFRRQGIAREDFFFYANPFSQTRGIKGDFCK